MKLYWQAQSLNKLGTLIGSVVSDKHPVPKYQYAYLGLFKDKPYLLGSNGELEIQAALPEEVKIEGDFTPSLIPIHRLHSLVKEQDGESVLCLDIDGDVLKLSGDQGDHYQLKVLPMPEDFPKLQFKEEESLRFEVSSHFLKEAMARGIHAMAKNDLRAYLNGLLIEFSKGSIHVVSTDGHRMVWSEGTQENTFEDKKQYILTKGVVDQIRSLLDTQKVSKTIVLEFTLRAVRIYFDSIVLTGKLIAEGYPDYRRVVPDFSARESSWYAAKSDLVSMARKAKIISNNQKPSLLLQNEGVELLGEAENEQDKAKLTLTLLRSQGTMKQAFNVHYFSDLLSSIHSSKIYGNFGEGVREGAYFEEVLEDDTHVKGIHYVLMPMSIQT